MKRNYFFLFAMLIGFFICNNAMAKVWRVNNISNYNGTTDWGDNVGGSVAYPVFKEIQEAIDFINLVLNYDTVHVEGAINTYLSFTLNRPLVLIGAGYFLQENTIEFGNVSHNPVLETKIRRFDIGSGSDGAVVSGFNIISETADPAIGISSNYITIKRCKVENSYIFIGDNTPDIHDLLITQNIFKLPGGVISGIFYNNPHYNIYINNNIFQCALKLGPSASVEECKNNIFDIQSDTGPEEIISIKTSSFKNNIIKNADAVVSINNGIRNSIITHNYFAISPAAIAPFQFDTSAAYKNEPFTPVQMQNLFVNTSASPDGNYRLRTGTVYNNTGSDNTNRGPFGGAAVDKRYSISGLGPIPVIYDISTSGVSDATGLPVTIKSRIAH